jgi:hypothetical protein
MGVIPFLGALLQSFQLVSRNLLVKASTSVLGDKNSPWGLFYYHVLNYFVAFLATGFLATGFLATTAFLAAGFAAVLAAGLATVFAAGLTAVFLAAPVASLTPALLAILERLALRRATVFFFSKPFLTAVSSSDCAALNVAAVGFAMKALVAALMSFLIPTFRSRRLIVCFARLMADLMIGMLALLPL